MITIQTPVTKQSLTPRQMPIVYVKGSHQDMGRQIGEAMAPAIHKMLAAYQSHFHVAYDQLEMSWEDAVLQARKYFPFAQEYTSQYVEELEGMAEGSGTDIDDLMVINCAEAILEDRLVLGCTSLALSSERTADGHVLVGHNEDWLPEDEDNSYLIHATPESEPPFLAITYGGLLPNIGFNAAGIAQACDSVYPTDVRVGVPRVFVSRAVLSQTRLSEAIRSTLMRWRAAGYNHLIAHNSGEMYNVEVSARHFATIYGMDGYLAHTNNYLTERMKKVEHKTEDKISSRVRFNRASRLLRNKHKHSVDSIKEILSDHVNYPNSICSHSDPTDHPLDRQKTIATLIMDLTAQEMHICCGNPCESTFDSYRLEA